VVKISTSLGSATLVVRLGNDVLKVSELVARLKELEVLRGSLAIPFLAEHLGGDVAKMIPMSGPVSADLRTPTLALAEIYERLDRGEPPVLGTVDLALTAGGSIQDLAVSLEVAASDVRSPAAADVRPADVSLTAKLADGALTVDGAVRQPQIEPLIVSGRMPLEIGELVDGGGLPPSTPISASVRMPKSSLGFVAALVPVVRFIEGTAEIDLTVGGTIAKPLIDGTVTADVPAVRLSMDGVPPITNVVVRIESNTERLTIPAFRGNIGGGVFGAEGGVTFGGVEQPVFDLSFGTRDALVLQSEAVTLRISSRVALTGPLDAAALSGSVYVTKSRFYQDIDILPIGLPGRPAPEPPPAPTVRGITAAPLSNWTLDLEVETADPFLVQGNLANGRIVADLDVTGTAGNPTMAGEVRIERLTTTLPFSELTIREGLVYFEKNQPFVAQFDIRGTSEIRDYNVTAYIYGTMLDPRVTFSSQPSLPQTDIVSLIATGVTSDDIANNPSVLAGRAAVLGFQKLSRAIFPPKDPSERKKTVLSDVDIGFGEIDPKTGRQSATVRFPLSKNFSLFGGVDVQGDFRGQVKYLIRFQ
jgi:autotransporter translocation and assembly factor TamB